MFTRQQYLNRECTHREYYAQFVGPWVVETVRRHIKLESLLESEDEYFNDTTTLAMWDRIPLQLSRGEMERHGDYLTGAGKVCILKEAARQIVESHQA